MSVELNQRPDPIFADGMSFKRNPNAPDYVIGQMSFKVEDAINFLKARSKNGWVNVDIDNQGNIVNNIKNVKIMGKIKAEVTAIVLNPDMKGNTGEFLAKFNLVVYLFLPVRFPQLVR